MSREWSGQVDEDVDRSREVGRESSGDEHRTGAAGRQSGEGTDTVDGDEDQGRASAGVETSGVVGDWVSTDSRSDLDEDHTIPTVPTDPPIRSFWISVVLGTLIALPFSPNALDSVILAVTFATGLAGWVRAGSQRAGAVAGAVTGPLALAVVLFGPGSGTPLTGLETVGLGVVTVLVGSMAMGYGAVCGAVGGAVGSSEPLASVRD